MGPDVGSSAAFSSSVSEPIRIEYFADVPMSDLEMIYPSKTFSLKPMDSLYLSVTLCIGAWAILKELFIGAGAGHWLSVLCIALMLRSIAWYRSTESEYVRALNGALVESNVSSDQSALLSLQDSVEEQQFVETLLAYFVLLRNSEVKDSAAVDALCEAFLRRAFGEDVNVQIENAMQKLSELGLFESGGMHSSEDDGITVKGLDEALKCAVMHYEAAIQRVRKIGQPHKEQTEQLGVTVSDEAGEVKEEKVVKEKHATPPIISACDISDDHFDAETVLID